MAASLAVIIFYAVVPQKFSVGDFSVKKIGLLQFKKQEFPLAKARPTTSRRRVKNHKFLFIGDSMVEGLSRRMGDYAKENGHTIYTVIWYSSTTEKWAETQTLEHFVDEYKPTYILLCLGSNELFVNDLDVRNEYIKTIVRKLSRYPFVWIGPADWNGDTGIIDLIASNAGKGHFFDSRNLKLQRGSDHYHPTWKAAAAWMDKVAAYMRGGTVAYPVRMELPKGHHKATHTELLAPAFEGY